MDWGVGGGAWCDAGERRVLPPLAFASHYSSMAAVLPAADPRLTRLPGRVLCCEVLQRSHLYEIFDKAFILGKAYELHGQIA